MLAYFLGKLGKQRIHRYVVQRRLMDGTIYLPQTVLPTVTISARSAGEACNAVLDETLEVYEQPAEVWTYGPKGGRTYRWRTWHGVIGANLLGWRLERCNTAQRTLDLDV